MTIIRVCTIILSVHYNVRAIDSDIIVQLLLLVIFNAIPARIGIFPFSLSLFLSLSLSHTHTHMRVV